MFNRTLAIVALAAAAIFLFVNRNTFTLQNVAIPAVAVGIVVWQVYQRGWLQLALEKFCQVRNKAAEEQSPKMESEENGHQSGSHPPNPSEEYGFDEKPQGAVSDTSSDRVYTINVPNTTKFEPERVTALIREFVAIRGVVFRIASLSGEVKWQVIDMGEDKVSPQIMARTIHKIYPEAAVLGPTRVEYQKADKPFYRAVEFIRQVDEFTFPIKSPREITHGDPLSTVANMLSNLDPDESGSFMIYMGDGDDQLQQKAFKMITVSPWSALDVVAIVLACFTIAGAVWAFFHAMNKVRAKRQPKYKEGDMGELYEKLHDIPLLRCLIVIEANSFSQERLQQFNILPAMLQVSKVPQKLMWSSKEAQVEHIWTDEQSRQTSAIERIRARKRQTKERAQVVNNGVCVFSPTEIATLWHLPHDGFTSSNIEWVKGKHVALPAVMRGNTTGIRLGDSYVSAGKTVPVRMLRRDRSTHMLVIGKPNMGKSTLLHNLVRQDITEGYGVCVIDPSPQGKLVEDILQRSIAEGREDDVFVWDLRDTQNPPPLNFMLSASQVEREDAAALIMSVFERVYGAEFGYSRMGHTLIMAMQAVMKEEIPTIRDVTKLFRDDEYRAKMTVDVESEAAYEFWEHWEKLSLAERETRADHVIRRLQRLYDNRVLYPIICQPKPLDFGELIRHRRILLVCLGVPEDGRLTPSDQSLLGSMMVSQIEMAMTAERFEQPFYVYVDEAQHFVTTSLPDIFAKARKQNLSLTLANQYLGQLVGDTLRAVEGTIGAMVSFQIGEADANKVDGMMKPEFSAYDLINLEVHQAAVRMYFNEKQMRPFTLNTLPDPPKPTSAEEREAAIRARSLENFTTMSRDDIVAWLTKRYPRKRSGKGSEEETFSDPL